MYISICWKFLKLEYYYLRIWVIKNPFMTILSNHMTTGYYSEDLLRKKETKFVILYTLILLISFSPWKALGQFVGVVCILGLLFYVQLKTKTHLWKFGIFLLGYCAIGCIYYFLMPEFSFINFFLILITLSSVFVIFYDLRLVSNPHVLARVSRITKWVIFIEAIYGITQGLVSAVKWGSFDLASGDHVRGTIEPSFQAMGLGGNVIYAILLSSLLLYVIGTNHLRLTSTNLLIYITVLVAWIVASVLHTILFVGLAVIISILIIRIPKKALKELRLLRNFRRRLLFILLIFVFLLPIFIPRNLRTARNYLSFILDIREDAYSEKSRAIYYTLFVLPEEVFLQPIIGIGPGQYSSRAALIRTGQYLQGSSVPLPAYISSSTQVILDYWKRVLNRPGQGSTYFPFSSWISLYGEFGLIGFFIAGAVVIFAAVRIRKWYSPYFTGLNLMMLILLFYLFFLGFQDNYWEFTQAIFPAFLVLKLGYCHLSLQNKNLSLPRSNSE